MLLVQLSPANAGYALTAASGDEVDLVVEVPVLDSGGLLGRPPFWSRSFCEVSEVTHVLFSRFHWSLKRPARQLWTGRFSDSASLPFNRRRGLGADVVHHPIDPFDLVNDPGRNSGQQIVGQMAPVGGHEVVGVHAPHREGIVVGAAVAHHTDALHGQAAPRTPAR